MKVLKQLTLLSALLLLQACLPDSFTKFKEEPAVKATEEGASGGNTTPPVGPCPFGVLDEVCEANPGTISYDIGFGTNTILIDILEFDEDAGEEEAILPLLPTISFVGDGLDFEEDGVREEFNKVATYTIDVQIPAGVGITFDTKDGSFKGKPLKNYSGTHVITMDFLGAVRTATVEVIFSDSVFQYQQENEHRLKIKVDQINTFIGQSSISTINGKTAEIIFVDKQNRTLYVKTEAGDDLIFAEGTLIDNRENFLSGEATIQSDPVFVFGSSAIDGLTNQAMLRSKLAIASISPTRFRDYQFTMLPSLAFTGLKFQAQSACYDVSSGDVDTFVQMPNFTPCENNDPNYLEISGGTLWGQIDPNKFPLPETPFQIQAQDSSGNFFETTVSLEFAPFPSDLNFSLSQDIAAKLLKTDNFVEGDFISDISGSRGVIKEIIPITDPTYTYAWITVQQGTFIAGTTVDNKPVYQNSSGTIVEFSPVNAKITTDNPIPATVEASLQQADNIGGFITSGTSSARLVLRNNNTAYIRVSSGSDYNTDDFSTGDALGGVDGNLFFGPAVEILNINGQHLKLSLASGIPNVAGVPTVSHDSNFIYSSFDDGSAYEGALHLRKINTIQDIEVEMTKGSLGIGTSFLRYGNPFSTATPSDEINEISTNSNRFVAYKDLGFKTLPVLEQSSEGTLFDITPPLPLGLELNQNTGEISGIPEDRADQAIYTISLSNALGSRNFKIALEVKDYIGLIDRTANASSYILHKAGMGNEREPCLISRDQFQADGTSERDIECFLDAAELDLFERGINLDFSLGNDMCQFYRVDPYYFARFEVPSVTNVTVPITAPPIADETIHTGDVSAVTCQTLAEPADNSRQVSPQLRCDYDYSTQIPELGSGYNCDVRTKAIRVVEYETFDSCGAGGPEYDADSCGTCNVGDPGEFNNKEDCLGATPTAGVWSSFTPTESCRSQVQVINHDCGGDVYQCVAGAGEDIGDREVLFNSNIGVRGNAEGVSKITTTYDSPSSKGYSSNKHLANFVNAPSCLSSNFNYLFSDFESGARSNHPFNNSGIIDNSFMGNPYYTYLCLDAANNVQARIRLVVREWNESFRTSSRIDYIDPDVVLTPDKMDSTGTNGFDEFLNSFLDWESTDYNDGANACNLVDGDFPELNL